MGCIVGDARALHSDPELQGALFQVASQFNLLEMTSPSVRPEDGVARYAGDPTQGPACAIAAGAATIYRNYCVPVGNQTGQTGDHQLDALATMGDVLAAELARPVTDLWTIRNGYALCTEPGLDAIAGLLEQAPDEQRDTLRGALRIGLHRDVEVTDVREGRRRLVSQAFCSALPINYSHTPHANWGPFARTILEATYEATPLAAAEQAATGMKRPGFPAHLVTCDRCAVRPWR